MSSTSTTWTVDTNTKSGGAQTFSTSISSLQILGEEGEDAVLKLFADEGDDNADHWRIVSSSSSNKLNFASYASGSWSNILSLSSTTIDIDGSGAMQINSSGGTIGIGNDDVDQNINIGTQGERTINIGTGSFADEVVIGNTTGASGVHLKAGTGDVQITGNLGIGVASPTSPLQVTQDHSSGAIAYIYNSEDETSSNGLNVQVENNNASTYALRVNTPTDTYTIAAMANGRVGIGLAVPTAKLHIDQSSASGAVPVLKLDQADTDDSFIDFIGTTSSDQTKSLSTDTSVGALTGHIKIEVNGSAYWLAYYAAN
jgi:hypothetical protein